MTSLVKSGSGKRLVILNLFRKRYDPLTGTLSRSEVTLDEVVEAILEVNSQLARPLSIKNPANFFKDFIRAGKNANTNWPAEVLAAGFTARQRTRNRLCFEFVPLPEGAQFAFTGIGSVELSEDAPLHCIQSVSLPMASRRLGRTDEAWMIQVVARLRIVETHFSLFSRLSIQQVDLLQLNVKLHGTEIDAIFLAIERVPEGFREIIITCEAKVAKDDILLDQVLRQAHAPFQMSSIEQDVVVPIAIKCVSPSTLAVVEFEPVLRSDDRDLPLKIASEARYRVEPPVPGLCK